MGQTRPGWCAAKAVSLPGPAAGRAGARAQRGHGWPAKLCEERGSHSEAEGLISLARLNKLISAAWAGPGGLPQLLGLCL